MLIGLLTLILHEAVLLPSFVVTVITASPDDNAVTSPVLSTFATALFEDVYVTSLLSASAGATVALSFTVSPFLRLTVVLSSATELTFITLLTPVTVSFLITVLDDVALTVAITSTVPAFLKLKVPSVAICAILLSDTDHITVLLSVVSSGVIFAVNLYFVSVYNVPDGPVTVTSVIWLNTLIVTADDFKLSLDTAVIVTVPVFFAVTSPVLLTTATDVSDDFHSTDFDCVVLSGIYFIPSCTFAPFSSSAGALVICIPVRLIISLATVTLHEAVLLPSFVVTVITASPDDNAVTSPVLSTFATALFEDVYVTSLLSASAGATVALSFTVSPFLRLTVVLSSATELTFITLLTPVTVSFLITVLDDVALTVAITSTVPAFLKLKVPSVAICAILLSDTDHITVLLSVVSSGVIFAVNLYFVSVYNVPDGPVTVTSVIWLNTLIVTFDCMLLSALDTAVIVTVPVFFAVTSPVLLTTATDASDVFHSTDFACVVLSGIYFIPSCTCAPFSSSAGALVIVIVLSCIISFSTVILHLAVFLPSSVITVITASPNDNAVTSPLSSTAATASLSDVKCTFLLSAFSGSTVALSLTVSFSLRTASVLSSDTDSTATVLISELSVYALILKFLFSLLP